MTDAVRFFIACGLLIASSSDAADLQFNRDIRPILSENCYHCHGPDENAREADLRLDTEDGSRESAVTPGDADASELYARVASDDEDLVMPPPDSERKLTAQQIELLKQWIDEGGSYESHWSFVAPKSGKLPDLKDDSRVTNPIDRYAFAKLEEAGFDAAEPADRETLIRRVTFDLIGLPPTIAEIDRFLADDSSTAYEDLIDRLLERKEFGERMASNWLDAARYSDTYGYQVDRDRYVWPWRDWVVKAFNSNMPYDQFITEQLAGDLLPGATRDQILATTFNRLHPQKVEGGSVPEEFRIEYVADRTQTVGTALMGLTFECCRCHNHKYDPLTQKEYYQLSAFFDNIDEAGLYSYFTPAIPTPTLSLPNDNQQVALENGAKAVAAAEQKLNATWQELQTIPTTTIDWTEMYPDGFAEPILHMDFESKATGRNTTVENGFRGKAIKLTGDDAVGTKVGNFRRDQPFSVALAINTPDVKERAVIFHRSRAWTDAASRGYQLLIEEGKLSWSLIHFWPGNAMRIRTVDPIPVNKWLHVVVTNDGSSRAAGLKIFIDGTEAKTEVVRDHLTKHITGGGGDNIAIGERFRDNGFKNGLIDELKVFQVELTSLEILQLANPEAAKMLVQTDASKLSTDAVSVLQQHISRRLVARAQVMSDRLGEARQTKFKLDDGLQEIMVMNETPHQRQTYLLNRGAYDDRGEPVDPLTPNVLPSFPSDAPRNRLGLAKWLTDKQHPLTSRVAVNRLWQLCFGVGLVRTPEDFGSQGEPPTHPELLDWMAVDFANHGWDVKRTIKRIMLSSTYRQSSQNADSKVAQADPENRLLARFPSYRLSAEMLRDNALAISGRLVQKVGGPPVKPYELEASFKPSKRDAGEGLYRRSLYTYWKRTGPAPAMMALDAAKRDVCRVQRERTSSPLQAFVLLNGPQYVEAARGLAEQLCGQTADTQQVLQIAFRRLTSRKASAKELVVLSELYEQQYKYFHETPDRASEYLKVGDANAIDSVSPIRLAATTVVVATVMNFDESVMKR